MVRPLDIKSIAELVFRSDLIVRLLLMTFNEKQCVIEMSVGKVYILL